MCWTDFDIKSATERVGNTAEDMPQKSTIDWTAYTTTLDFTSFATPGFQNCTSNIVLF